MPNFKKLQTIRDWKRLVRIIGIKFFLSLAKLEVYKMIFVGGETTFKPFQKKKSFEWKEEQQRAFEDLKDKLLSTLG